MIIWSLFGYNYLHLNEAYTVTDNRDNKMSVYFVESPRLNKFKISKKLISDPT